MLRLCCCCWCCCCCSAWNRVHPMENICDVSKDHDQMSTLARQTVDSEQFLDISAHVLDEHDEGITTVQNSTGVVTSMPSRMQTSGSSDLSVYRDNTEVTPMHAAAVNGDKSSLSKLLISNPRDLNTGDKFGKTPLMYCVLGDRIDCGEMLIKAGCDVNRKDIGGRTALHWAGHKGNFLYLKLLLSKGANWKEKDNEGQTAMHLSTRHKSPKCLALLMKQLEMAEVDDQDKKKRTSLHWAASHGNLEHVKMLIKLDSNIGIPDEEGKTPLHWAASSKSGQSVDCVQLILETTPSVLNWQDYEGRTSLHLAVADGNIDVVTALTALEKCEVSALDNMFRTPLHWAAVLGHSQIVRILLDRHADYSSSDSIGATPLHYASQNNFADTVQVFLERKGVKDEPDNEGRTAFMWAARKGADDVIRCFIRCGVDMKQIDKNGGTSLHTAALTGHASTVKLLLLNSADIDTTDLMKHTPLFHACEVGSMSVVQTLIDCGAKVDMVDQDGRSPLHWAALGGHAYICQTLIKFGIDANVRDISGRSSLQCAAYGGFVNCMSVLIEHKSDANAQDNEGMTALHWACSKGHIDAVKLLIEFHAFPNHMEFTEDRYTPLDYALMGEHYEVAQYMIEQGGLSITGIQDIAALKIQAVFRGYRVRKTFLDRKRLLMKHEQLRKDAAKKKAQEECKKKEDKRKKKDAPNRRTEDDEKVDSCESNGFCSDQLENNEPEPVVVHSEIGSHTVIKSQKEAPVVKPMSSEDSGNVGPKGHTSTAPHANVECDAEKQNASHSDSRRRPSSRHSKHGQTANSSPKSASSKSRKKFKSSRHTSSSCAANHENNARGSSSQEIKHCESESDARSNTCSREAPKVHETSTPQPRPRSKHHKKKREKELTEEQKAALKQEETRQLVLSERLRVREHRRKEHAARVIQRAWKRYMYQTHGVWGAARDTAREKRLQLGEQEWTDQIAALTIQLAWRKYYRRKLLRSLTPGRRKILHMWDPEIVAMKQRALVQRVYAEGRSNTQVDWKPKSKRNIRPSWYKYIPSPAALSYNFAVDQYHPHSGHKHKSTRHSWSSYDTVEPSEDLKQTQSSDSSQRRHFSYNMCDT